MPKTPIIISAAALTSIIFAALWTSPQNLTANCNGKPCNVVLIILDTVGAKHLSGYGYKRQTTPFIDDFFIKNGSVFSNAWSTGPWTLPSFTGMLASQYPEDAQRE